MIHPDSFFTISNKDVLLLLGDEFSEELERLKRAYSIRDRSFTAPSTPSPSRILFGQAFDEVNRTLVSVLALRWLVNGQYETFVSNQPQPVRLTRESFDWMRDLFVHFFRDPDELYALISVVVINDLGKDEELTLDYHDLTGDDISTLNHDMILIKAVDAGLVHCLDRLPGDQKQDVVCGLRLGAKFNFGQLAQAENAPACLSSLMDMRSRPHAFELHFLEQLLDIAGAAGHMDWTCAKKLVEPIIQAYRNAYDAATGVIAGNLGLRDGYDLILVRRAQLLQEEGFRELNVRDPEDRALMRLLCMAGVADVEGAKLFDETWATLEIVTKKSLVHSLNIDGSTMEPAVQPTYMPALLTQAVDVDGPRSRRTKQAYLRSALRYLVRVMTIGVKPDGHTTVIERNVLGVLKGVVQSPEFRADATILEQATVSESTIAMTERVI
ncbi:hypothetical protein F5882DRAFT_489810 [Hyaloscypha sp. PMI_1271]|nr:hypothetical protein F5882DRAFT_489810 [Hyaloscypha sp. PMI_1271]